MKKAALVLIGILSISLSGCDKLSGEKAQEKTVFQKLKDGESYISHRAWLQEVCSATGATANYDSAARREILKDYGFDLTAIAKFEVNKEVIFLDNNLCPMRVGYTIQGVYD